MLENVPWAVEGGQISGAVMRMLADDIAPGKTGVRQSGDFKVRQLEAATDQVRIAPGGYTAYNEYITDSGQAYKGRAADESLLTVPHTGSQSGSVHYVIIRVSDPDFPNEPVPDDTLNGPYNWFELVPSISNLNYPHVPLAKITQPINNTVIKQTMIEDIRELANPRTYTVLRPQPQHAGDPGQSLGSKNPVGEYFPNAGWQDIAIPKWAVRMQIVADWTQINYSDANSVGRCWVEWGPSTGTSTRKYKTEEFGFNGDGGIGATRGNWRVGDDVYIPYEERGKTHRFIYKARYNETSSEGVSMDGLSGTIMQVRFVEDPD